MYSNDCYVLIVSQTTVEMKLYKIILLISSKIKHPATVIDLMIALTSKGPSEDQISEYI